MVAALLSMYKQTKQIQVRTHELNFKGTFLIVKRTGISLVFSVRGEALTSLLFPVYIRFYNWRKKTTDNNYHISYEYTVFTRIDAAAFISFFAIQLRRLFEGGVYSGAAFIPKSLYSVLNIVLHMVTFFLGNSNKSLH